MNVDHYYTKGTFHRENQDYALSGFRDGKPFAIISDGCSSADKSDVGARLLAISAGTEVYKNNWTDEAFGHISVGRAQSLCRAMLLNEDALCATLLVATIENNLAKFSIYGDGVIAYKYKKAPIVIIQYEFESGAPFYLRYQLDDEKLLGYGKEFGFNYKITSYENGEIKFQNSELSGRLHKDNFHFNCCVPLENLEFVAVMSDGVASFLENNKTETSISSTNVPIPLVVEELLGFKNFTGEFVHRRCNRAFNRNFPQKGWHNADDVSIAAIYFGE